MRVDRLWISWENQRRSLTLSAYFGCALEVIERKGALRYLYCSRRTIAVLIALRPKVLFVQNPSMLLAAISVLWGCVTDAYVVVDRHSTFLLGRESEHSISLWLFRVLNRFTLRFADLTIVTNSYLGGLVEAAGGRPFVLPDKIPDWSDQVSKSVTQTGKKRTVFFVCSFADDEPVAEVLEAAGNVGEPIDVSLVISGNFKRLPSSMIAAAPSNVIFTGFLSDHDYVQAMLASDMVMVLSTAEHTLLCGCYEALAAGKPLITSATDVLQDYFRGAIFVDNTVESIRRAITMPIELIEAARQSLEARMNEITDEWQVQAADLNQLISRAELYAE